ncbi:hypothetical protein [Geothermobacter hydrogeniphilus]|nr:hypothetical protein [Geothermobacter hydrogeniphilus]
MTRQGRMWRSWVYVALAATSVFLLFGCSDSDNAPAIQPTVKVTDTAGNVVEGATVFAIPAADVTEISAQPITLQADGDYAPASMNVDEPLEDLVNGNFTPTSGGVANYVTAVTDASGKAVLKGLSTAASDKFFIYVAPDTADSSHLPGGSLCRNAVTGASLNNKVTAVELSTTPSATATYIGSSACLSCHDGTDAPDKSGVMQTAHKHGIMNIGSPSGLQDLTRFDANDGIYNYMAGVDMFTAGDITSGGTTVYFYDYDATRGFDKFQTQMTDPGVGHTVYATVRLYKDSTTNKYMMQITNVLNATDPASPTTIEAVMTYGGGVYKQRYLAADGSDSLHMLPLQYQASGDDSSGDRTRKQYRDYHMDRWYDVATDTLTLPNDDKSFDINCAACHYNGYQVVQNTNGTFTATAVADPNGTINPLNGQAEEMNVGCETCHGPGSEHQAAGGNGVAIVNPNNLSVSRVTMICGRCHSRPEGNNSFGTHTDQPLNTSNEMLRPGGSRADYLANYTFRDDANSGSMWGDGLHSKSHHQQYTDFIKTVKYRNGSALKTCVDCHEIHAPGTDRHQLSGTSDNTLCAGCHPTQGADIQAHMEAKTGTTAMPATTMCIQCHFTKNAKSGAGDPVGKVGASGTTYRHNDISSHLLDVPTKADTSTTNAMPVPYTNTCGSCHSLSAPL